ncbi:MAG: hypothetical protein Q4D88_05185 [Anaerococcus sp.]|nr:hypothetical protein [Anaerococcus sp.]
MEIYLINSKDPDIRTRFSTSIGEKIKNKGKTLIIANQRDQVNIEDYFLKDGMITYDLYDYFSKLVSFDRVLVEEEENLDFIIAPLLADKYEVKEEDYTNLIGQAAYENIILDGLEDKKIDKSKSLRILTSDRLEESFDEDYFIIKVTDKDFDVRVHKDKIDSFKKKYLGLYKDPSDLGRLVENFLNDKQEEIEKIGFFEKIRMKFK